MDTKPPGFTVSEWTTIMAARKWAAENPNRAKNPLAEQMTLNILAEHEAYLLRHGLPVPRVALSSVADTPGAIELTMTPKPISRKRRRDLVTPSIEAAQGQCSDPLDAAAVWLILVAQAEKCAKPFIGVSDEGLKWFDGNDAPQFLTLKNLRDRITRKPKAASVSRIK